MYQPYGSPRAKQAAKRIRQAPAPTYRRKYLPRSANVYSAFQKSSGIERKNIDDSAAKWTTTVATWTITVLNDVAQGDCNHSPRAKDPHEECSCSRHVDQLLFG